MASVRLFVKTIITNKCNNRPLFVVVGGRCRSSSHRCISVDDTSFNVCSRRYLTTTSKDDKDDATERHRLFKQQMEELEQERKKLFGEDSEVIANNNNNNSTDTTTMKHMEEENLLTENDDEDDKRYKEQMDDMKAEREALFGFTKNDHIAWSTGGSNHKHDASFMEEIEQARMELKKKQKQETEKMNELTTSTQVHSSSTTSTSLIDDYYSTSTTGLTHITKDGTSVHMVDVGNKDITKRTATAQSVVIFPHEVLDAFGRSTNDKELVGPKGPIFATAITAGIMAAKQTSNLIPLCHPLPIEKIHIDIQWRNHYSIIITCTCRVTHKTGVEMEALTGASIAALTIYDMVKAVSHNVQITDTQLVYKDGGKRNIDKR